MEMGNESHLRDLIAVAQEYDGFVVMRETEMDGETIWEGVLATLTTDDPGLVALTLDLERGIETFLFRPRDLADALRRLGK
jgi:hypothetical protein